MNITDRIRAQRKKRGLSQKELAQKLGVSQNTIASYESGRTEPGIAALAKLAGLFGVTTDYLIGVQPPAAGEDSELAGRIRALPPEDKLVAHKIISALEDKTKAQSR